MAQPLMTTYNRLDVAFSEECLELVDRQFLRCIGVADEHLDRHDDQQENGDIYEDCAGGAAHAAPCRLNQTPPLAIRPVVRPIICDFKAYAAAKRLRRRYLVPGTRYLGVPRATRRHGLERRLSGAAAAQSPSLPTDR